MCLDCDDTDERPRAVAQFNVIGNYFKRGEIADPNVREIALDEAASVYAGDPVYGNIGPSRPRPQNDPWDAVSYHKPVGQDGDGAWSWRSAYPAPREHQSVAPFGPATLPPYVTAEEAYRDVLGDVGANRALVADGSWRDATDAVDRRVVRQVQEGTGRMIDSPEDVAGWPDLARGTPYADTDGDGMSDAWELRSFGTLDPDGTGDLNGDGYTDLERFLNGAAPFTGSRPHER